MLRFLWRNDRAGEASKMVNASINFGQIGSIRRSEGLFESVPKKSDELLFLSNAEESRLDACLVHDYGWYLLFNAVWFRLAMMSGATTLDEGYSLQQSDFFETNGSACFEAITSMMISAPLLSLVLRRAGSLLPVNASLVSEVAKAEAMLSGAALHKGALAKADPNTAPLVLAGMEHLILASQFIGIEQGMSTRSLSIDDYLEGVIDMQAYLSTVLAEAPFSDAKSDLAITAAFAEAGL